MNRILSILSLTIAFNGAAQGPLAEEIRQILLELHPQRASLIHQLSLEPEKLDDQLRKLDPYARYVPAQKPIMTAGIGAQLYRRGNQWWLLPYARGPLHAAGITEPVRLLAIEGQNVAGLSAERLAKRIQGADGSVVCLRLQLRQRIREICVARANVRPPSIEQVGEDELRIYRFEAHTTRMALQAYLEHWTAPHLILDLRGAGGGDLYESLDSAALFLPPGTVMVRLLEEKKPLQVVKVPEHLPTFDLPLVIRVGRDTASAAEIFAGVLQYHQRAHLVGARTYGKCVSQAIYELSNGAHLRLTNMRVEFPDGSTCQGRGLSPEARTITKLHNQGEKNATQETR